MDFSALDFLFFIFWTSWPSRGLYLDRPHTLYVSVFLQDALKDHIKHQKLTSFLLSFFLFSIICLSSHLPRLQWSPCLGQLACNTSVPSATSSSRTTTTCGGTSRSTLGYAWRTGPESRRREQRRELPARWWRRRRTRRQWRWGPEGGRRGPMFPSPCCTSPRLPLSPLPVCWRAFSSLPWVVRIVKGWPCQT